MIFIVLIVLFACTSKPQFIINGNVKNADNLQVKLVLRMEKEYVTIDSTIISDGKFILKGSVEFPDVAYLEIAEKESKKSFYLENSVITFTGDADSLLNSSIKGSVTEDEYVKSWKNNIKMTAHKAFHTFYEIDGVDDSQTPVETTITTITTTQNKKSSFCCTFRQIQSFPKICPGVTRHCIFLKSGLSSPV